MNSDLTSNETKASPLDLNTDGLLPVCMVLLAHIPQIWAFSPQRTNFKHLLAYPKNNGAIRQFPNPPETVCTASSSLLVMHTSLNTMISCPLLFLPFLSFIFSHRLWCLPPTLTDECFVLLYQHLASHSSPVIAASYFRLIHFQVHYSG